jgi:hypothetical protein
MDLPPGLYFDSHKSHVALKRVMQFVGFNLDLNTGILPPVNVEMQ